MPQTDYDFAELFPISELIGRLPPLPGGAKHATSKIYGWLNLSNDPARKTLRSVAIGRARYTCDRWLRDFIDGYRPGQSTQTPARRIAARERAKKALEAAGI